MLHEITGDFLTLLLGLYLPDSKSTASNGPSKKAGTQQKHLPNISLTPPNMGYFGVFLPLRPKFSDLSLNP